MAGNKQPDCYHGELDSHFNVRLCMKGAYLIDLLSHVDPRGRLTPFDRSNLPFDVKHVFVIHDVPESAMRGDHASSSDEALVVMHGDLVIDLDNGNETMTVHLSRSDKALWVKAGVRLQLRNFSPGTILLAFASVPYADWCRFDRPQPQLLTEFGREP